MNVALLTRMTLKMVPPLPKGSRSTTVKLSRSGEKTREKPSVSMTQVSVWNPWKYQTTSSGETDAEVEFKKDMNALVSKLAEVMLVMLSLSAMERGVVATSKEKG